MKAGRNFKSLSTSNLNNKSEKEVMIKDFGGVDYSQSTLFVDTSRATQMSNFIKNGGINEKRKGYHEKFRMPNNGRINGAWVSNLRRYIDEEWKYVETLIISAGRKVYYKDEYTEEFTEVENSFYANSDNKNLKGFSYSGKLYLLTGERYVCIGDYGSGLEVEPVYNGKHTYIPTTTINVPPVNYNEFQDNIDNVLKSSSYEQVNLMSSYRINKLIGILDFDTLLAYFRDYQIKRLGYVLKDGSYINSSGNPVTVDPYDPFNITTSNTVAEYSSIYNRYRPFDFKYKLDGLPLSNEEYGNLGMIKVTVNGRIYLPYGIKKFYNRTDVQELNNAITGHSSWVTQANKIKCYEEEGEGKIGYIDLKDYVIYPTTSINEMLQFLYQKDSVTGNTLWTCCNRPTLGCYVYKENVVQENGTYTGDCYLVFNYPIVSTDGNVCPITVEYQRVNTAYASKINKSTIGCMFGYSQDNRLFVSGNPDEPNMDWHTLEPLESGDYNELSYFGDLTYSQIGGSENKINGYSLLGDGKLAIFKTYSADSPSLYIRNATITQENVSDYNGNDYIKITENYPIQIGSIGVGSVGFDTIKNLNGDILMVSENGVYGLEIDSNVSSSQRWARKRSTLIEPVLKKYDLSKAVCFVYDNRFYISLGDGKTFLADARYPITIDGDVQGNYQYEWWEWNNVNPTVYFEYQGKLYFGTDSGRVCCFNDENYTDVTYETIGSADVTIYKETDVLVLNKEYEEELNYSDEFEIKSDLYALAIDTNDENVTIVNDSLGLGILYDYSHIPKDEVEQFIIDKYVLLNYHLITDNQNGYHAEFIINEVLNDEENKILQFRMFEMENDTSIDYLKNKGYRILIKLKDNTFKISNIFAEINGVLIKKEEISREGDIYYFFEIASSSQTILEAKPIYNHFSIEDSKSKTKIDLTDFDGVEPIIESGTLIRNTVVNALYITPPFDFGTRNYNKDLRKLIIVPDNMYGTQVDFGFLTSNYDKDFEVYTGDGLTFEKIDFDNIDFGSEIFARVYVKQARKKRWSFIQFFFKSSTNNNCKINNLTIIYKLGTKNRGVR